MLTQRDYLEIELQGLERRLADVTAPGRQVAPTEEGRAYREKLEDDIAELRERLASEGG
ncbi:MAG: hypothetical protein K0S82_15 [Gaiellaceae bacterium]|jgi:hypothetical protein|nr:hypothetical protein [Gaiellaceae bacterium]